MQTTQPPTTELGRTGLVITRVGLGAWAIGGGGREHGWGPLDAARPPAVPLPSAATADQMLTVARASGYERRDLAGLFDVLAATSTDRARA